jgi:hypothetical protein
MGRYRREVSRGPSSAARMLLLPVLLLVAVLSACGSSHDETAHTTGTTSTTVKPSTSTTGAPTPATADVIISIVSGGGFVPYGYDFAAVPTLVLRDGTVLTAGAMTMQYPGAAVNAVVTGRLSAEDVAALLAAAKRAGLDGDHLDAGRPGVSDQPTTTIVVEVDGRRHSNQAYGLGDGGDPSRGGPGLTAEQAAVRKAMGGFVRTVSDTATRVATRPYGPTGYQVVAQPIDPASSSGQDIEPNDLDWPFADLSLTAGVDGRCVDVAGSRTATFAAVLGKATQITRWHTADGATYSLSIRATLPGYPDCSAKS